MKRFNTRINVKDASLLTSAVTTGEFSIAAFASGAGLLVGIALSGTGRFFFTCNSNYTNYTKIL